MTLTITLARKVPAKAELAAHALTKEGVSDADPDALGVDWDVLKSRGFDGSVGQVEIVGGPSGPTAMLGLGPDEDLSPSAFRQAGAALARAANRHKRIGADVLAAGGETVTKPQVAQAFAEGLELGAYTYTALKSEPEPNKLVAVTLVGAGKAVTAAVEKGQAIAGGVNLARDLVNEPGGSMTPVAFARKATQVAKANKLTIKVLGLPEIKKAKLGGLLGVNRGSDQPPRFVEISYKPTGKSKGHIALVGKGVTFDSGGLSIKPAAGMMTMKCDMGGAAAVLGAVSTLSTVAPSVKVTGYIPLTDNMLGGDATRPGDVLTARNGKTIEVLNTDAEGRLILADALSLASEAKPDVIVDLATLTGACMVALGPRYAGVMGTSQDTIDAILASGGRTGERVWQLPLPAEYRTMLDSTVADVKNIGGPYGGAITAGLFLKEFVAEGQAWAHIDIAAPAFLDAPFEEHTKGGTGFGVRLLVDLIENYGARP